jgi:hypothetical protein
MLHLTGFDIKVFLNLEVNWTGGKKVNEGDEGGGIWLMDFKYLYEIEQWNILQLLEVGRGGSQGGEMVGTI